MIDLSPQAFRMLGYQAIDLIVERLIALPYTPVRQPVPLEVREQLMHAPLPATGTEADSSVQPTRRNGAALPDGQRQRALFRVGQFAARADGHSRRIVRRRARSERRRGRSRRDLRRARRPQLDQGDFRLPRRCRRNPDQRRQRRQLDPAGGDAPRQVARRSPRAGLQWRTRPDGDLHLDAGA